MGAALFDCVAALAARSLGAPMGFVCFVDGATQTFVGRFRWPFDALEGDDIIGADALRSGEPCDVADTHLVQSQRSDRLAAAAPHVRSYCVAPIRPPSGETAGLIGIADAVPRAVLTPDELRTLSDVAGMVALQLHMMRHAQARQKAGELALKRSEAELQRAQSMAHLGHWTWRPAPDAATPWEGTSIYSPAGAALFGVAPEELNIPSDQYIERFVHPDDRATVRQTLLDHGGPNGDGYTLEYRILRADQEVRVVCELAELVHDTNGRYRHTIGVVQDITETKRTEAALRESRRRFRDMANAMPNLLWVADAEGRITFLNRRWEEYSGVPVAENIGRLWAKETHPEDLAQLDAQFREGLYSAGNHEIRLRRKDGLYRWFLDTAAYRMNDDGELLGYIGTLTDIDDMRRLGEQLRQSQKMEAVGQLTGGIAHDFNNLLTIILGNAELLEERVCDPELQRLASATLGAAERSAALVRRLLAFSRRQSLQPAVTDVNALIAEMRELIERILGGTIEVFVSCESDLPPIVIDRVQIESAVLNLAINSRDAMPDGGRLTIETTVTFLEANCAATDSEAMVGEYVCLAISDTGVGMTPEVVEQAFEPFFTTKGPGRGTGLGLSMVYGFVKQSGGHIRLYSEPGHGTTIKIYLKVPADADRTVKTRGVATPAREAVGGHEKILLVEDDERVREHVIGQLQELGYHVVATASGTEALARLDDEAGFALLFTDMMMPGMTGGELAAEAKRRHPGLKVIFTTGYTQEAIVHQGHLDAGIELLSKPYPRRELARKLRVVLDR
jgi:PAS domain S-box-containing protein